MSGHSEAVDSLGKKAQQLNLDKDFAAIEEQYNTVLKRAEERVKQLEQSADEHCKYYEVSQDFSDWINSAKEELDRWSDISGAKDKETFQKKLQKIQVYIVCNLFQESNTNQ